jgi:hypothetical protein
MRSTLLIALAALGLVAFEGRHERAFAQQPPSSGEPAGTVGRKPEVIVKAQREQLQQRVSTFVNQVTDFRFGEGLARWQTPVCPLVAGVSRHWGEYILGRVSDIGKAAGVPLAGEHCHPNLFILVSKQPEAFLRDLEKRHRLIVFGGASPQLIDAFIAAPRPVRTWYDTVQRTAEGLPMMSTSFPGVSQQNEAMHSLGVVIEEPVEPNDPLQLTTNPWSQASHLTLNVVWAIYQVFVVVDPTRFKGVSLGQLTDYVAMAGLAQLKVDARLGDAPSILTLFDKAPQEASPGMTEWDQAFLKSVYATEQKSVVQRSQIALGMVRDIAPQ